MPFSSVTAPLLLASPHLRHHELEPLMIMSLRESGKLLSSNPRLKISGKSWSPFTSLRAGLTFLWEHCKGLFDYCDSYVIFILAFYI